MEKKNDKSQKLNVSDDDSIWLGKCVTAGLLGAKQDMEYFFTRYLHHAGNRTVSIEGGLTLDKNVYVLQGKILCWTFSISLKLF